MFDGKIFVIGFNKTATLSIHKFFKQNEIESIHWREPDPETGRFIALEMANNLEAHRPILHKIDGYVAYSDLSYVTHERVIEGGLFFPELYEEYPDAIFLLNTRPIDGWILSRLRHKDLAERFCKVYDLDLDGLIKHWRTARSDAERQMVEFFAGNPNFCRFDITQGFEPMFELLKRREVAITDWNMPMVHVGKNKKAEQKAFEERQARSRRGLARFRSKR